MSRRRISVKELGMVDCQGWLLRRKDGRSFLGSKWKRYWFVLQKNFLYWYTDKMDEKAEGFINLSGFTIQQAKDCRRKHAITAAHPLVVTLLVAAESFVEMNKWIRKLSEAVELCGTVDAAECYSEASDQDESEQQTAEFENGDVLSEPSPPSADRAPSVPQICVGDVHEKDELVNLSPMRRSSRRDFMASFIRRCQNDKVNEKVHHLRILKSTLKAKEAALMAVEQILKDTPLTPSRYRKWRQSNQLLLQEISQQSQAAAAGGATCRRGCWFQSLTDEMDSAPAL